MATWTESELAITQSLDRIEKSVDRIEQRIIMLETTQANQSGKVSIISVVVSAVVSAVMIVFGKLMFKGS